MSVVVVLVIELCSSMGNKEFVIGADMHNFNRTRITYARRALPMRYRDACDSLFRSQTSATATAARQVLLICALLLVGRCWHTDSSISL